MKEIIRKLACAICKALGGELVVQPVDVGPVEGSSPRINDNTPSPAYLDGKMPTYEVDDLIQHIEFRIGIHETYWGLVEDDPYTWSGTGTAEFHIWAIEGYENVIYYLRR